MKKSCLEKYKWRVHTKKQKTSNRIQQWDLADTESTKKILEHRLDAEMVDQEKQGMQITQFRYDWCGKVLKMLRRDTYTSLNMWWGEKRVTLQVYWTHRWRAGSLKRQWRDYISEDIRKIGLSDWDSKDTNEWKQKIWNSRPWAEKSWRRLPMQDSREAY